MVQEGITSDEMIITKGKYKKTKPDFKDAYYHQFGKYIINRRQLNLNKLLIKYKGHLGPVSGFPSTKISDTFKSLIDEMLDINQINIQTQKNLSTTEADLFDRLIRKCGLVNVLDYQYRTKDINDYMQRFEILRGSFLAGNRDVIGELRDVINLLSNPAIGKISNKDANEMLAEL